MACNTGRPCPVREKPADRVGLLSRVSVMLATALTPSSGKFAPLAPDRDEFDRSPKYLCYPADETLGRLR